MTISDDYKKNILLMFGEVGEKWLSSIPKLVDQYTQFFHLSNVRILDSLTYNVLLFAESADYGPVVLKIEIPFKEMTIRESVALELNQGVGACRCFYKNIDDGVLLIERLSPGCSLNEIEKLEDRTRIFATVANKFNIPINFDTELPTYSSILSRSVNMASEQKEKFADIAHLISKADNMYKEIESKGNNNFLLHSDLYSDNILMSNDGWKAIDPHGFIGNKIFDTAIFAQKELDKISYDIGNIDYVLELLSKYCGYSKQDISIAFYVNYVLNICWDREVNLDTTKSIIRANVIHDYIFENDKTINMSNYKKLSKKRNY